MQVRRTVLILPLFAIALTQIAAGQQPTETAPAATTQTPAATPAAAPVWQSTTVPAGGGKPQDATKPAPPAKPEKPAKAEKAAKPKKAEYTGPTEVVVLPPSPMLDENGSQRLDPDGKPMFNPPLKQQRDKKGHPLFDDKGKPVYQTAKDPGYDEHGKKIHTAKEKAPKLVPVHIARGTFSVDGVVGKAALNYDISDLKYLYMYVPGMGVVVVSNVTFPGAKEQKNAFNGNTLTVTVMEHKLELASDNGFLGKKPESAFVRIDRESTLPSKFPVVGYGTLRVAPYAWPGAKPNAVLAGTLPPPPLPKNLQPTLLVQPCPKGQTRAAAAVKAQPGATALPGPCMVAGAKGATGSTGAQAAPVPQQNLGR